MDPIGSKKQKATKASKASTSFLMLLFLPEKNKRLTCCYVKKKATKSNKKQHPLRPPSTLFIPFFISIHLICCCFCCFCMLFFEGEKSSPR
jgi:hypothetical protein